MPKFNLGIDDDKTIIKVLFLGAANAGKSSLIQRYCANKFTGTRVATIGVDFLSKDIDFAPDLPIVIQCWDTAGQERFASGGITSAFYRRADGIILVYDITSMESAEQLSKWNDEAQGVLGTKTPTIVIGNKHDRMPKNPDSNPVLFEDITAVRSFVDVWCKEVGYIHLECSAKDNFGVEACMMAIISNALEERKRKECSRPAGAPKANLRDSVAIDQLFVKPKDPACGCK